MRSIRGRLVLLLALGFALLIAIAGMVLLRAVKDHVTEEFDAGLLAQARALVSLTEQEGGQIEFDYDAAHMPEYEREDDPDLFQFWLDDGTMLLRSRRLQGDLLRDDGPADAPRTRDVVLPDGRAGRQVQLAYVPKGSAEQAEAQGAEPEAIGAASPARGLVLVVARGRGRLDGLLGRIALAVLLVGIGVTLLAVFVAWRAVAAGLRPVDAIAAQVETLDAQHLKRRVELPRAPRELAPVVEQLNALLERLDGAFERERRFTANVAHELRTPIAELRALAEVGAKWPEDETSVVRFFEDVHGVATRMEGVIADLLLLARCQAGVERARSETVDLREAVATAASRRAAEALERGHCLILDVPEEILVESDPGKLALILDNLLDNAVSYAAAGGEIRCGARRRGTTFRLDVENPAEPMASAELRRLAEPFWRRDEARASTRHAGLGLSVVRELAALLGLRVRFEQDGSGTFRVRLEGPAQAARRRGAVPTAT